MDIKVYWYVRMFFVDYNRFVFYLLMGKMKEKIVWIIVSIFLVCVCWILILGWGKWYIV